MTSTDDTEQPDTALAARLTVAPASLDDWHGVVEWAAAEDWNPGDGDTPCFHPTDPAGFFLGRLDGKPVSAISIVGYSPEYAFLGYYLVHPEYRGRGLGLATWRAAWPYAGDRTVGLDAVPAQQPIYERCGFVAAYRTLRYAGRPRRSAPAGPAESTGSAEPAGSADSAGSAGSAGPSVRPVGARELDAIAAYDRQCFPADRYAFLGRWLGGGERTAYVCERDGAVAGYGVLRPARDGQRIGPLFADDAEAATALFDALAGRLAPGEEVYIDVPESNTAACALAEARGLTERSHTIRMYRGADNRELPPVTRTFGVTSLELG